jgi:hypothetical protein
MDEWLIGWMDVWLLVEWMAFRTNVFSMVGWLDDWLVEWINGRLAGSVNDQLDGRVNGWIAE